MGRGGGQGQCCEYLIVSQASVFTWLCLLRFPFPYEALFSAFG